MNLPVSSFSVFQFAGEEDWSELSTFLDPHAGKASRTIVARLRANGAVFALIENDYVDRDFSADYSAFWSRLFRPYGRRTRRIHFFRIVLNEILERTPAEVSRGLEMADEAGHYLGFIVQRPILHAPIAKALLRPPIGILHPPDATEGHTPPSDLGLPKQDGKRSTRVLPKLEVRAEYEAHLLGACLHIRTVPFSQQDKSISSCAQVALWTCGRHFHSRHGAAWFSMPEINAAALQQLDEVSAQSLPAGSGGIDLNGVLRTLRTLGQQPFPYIRPRRGQRIWPKELQPEAVVARYVDSGLPVILVLRDKRTGRAGFNGSGDLHAVVVVGMAVDWGRPLKTRAGEDLTMGHFVTHFLVHDDTVGPFVRVPVEPEAGGEVPYDVENWADVIIIPIPQNVYLTAEVAELRSRDLLKEHFGAWPGLKAKHGDRLGAASIAWADAICRRKQEIVARTYLTLGWKYKKRLVASTAHSALRRRALIANLPKMLWVTEFLGPPDEASDFPEARPVIGHCAIDATTAAVRRPPMVFHAPGFAWFWDGSIDEKGSLGDDAAEFLVLADDGSYGPKVRST